MQKENNILIGLMHQKKEKKIGFQGIIFFCALFLMLSFPSHLSAEENEEALMIIETAIEDVMAWEENQYGISEDKLPTKALENAGDASIDWLLFSYGRMGAEINSDDYLLMLKKNLDKRYQTEEKLSRSKATEWHRISLTLLALGQDPTNFLKDDNHAAVNLIADGTYNRGNGGNLLGRQGLNGWIWGLLTLDSLHYKIPHASDITRDDIITNIIEAQKEDGGFSLNLMDSVSDVDITAMAIQALAPYYNSEKIYDYELATSENSKKQSVRDVIDDALAFLSSIQNDTGDFSMNDLPNLESSAQVLIALTSLNIDPLTDERFIKNKKNLLEVISSYQKPDGGFIHSEIYDKENKFADPNASNSMASEQAMYALIALYRQMVNERHLYDLRPEISAEDAENIVLAEDAIQSLTKESNQEAVEKAKDLYEKVADHEKSYVANYAILSQYLSEHQLEKPSVDFIEVMSESTEGKGDVVNLFSNEAQAEKNNQFTETDASLADEILSKEISTEDYPETLSLIKKLEFEDSNQAMYKKYLSDLKALKKSIDKREEEINEMNESIISQLYPSQQVSLDDKSTVESIDTRYHSFSIYDQGKVKAATELKQAKKEIQKLERYRWIKLITSVLIIVLGFVLFQRWRKRKLSKWQYK